MPARFTIITDTAQLQGLDAILVVGRSERVLEADILSLVSALVPERAWRTMVKRTDPGDNGRVATHWTGGAPARVSVGVLPEVCSRHNSPARAWAIPHVVHGGAQKGNVGVILALEEGEHALAATLAVARALPTFSATSNPVDREVRLLMLPRRGTAPDAQRLAIAADAVRIAAHLTDQPPDLLGCDAFVDRARHMADQVGASVHVLRSDGLREQGLNGIYSVGRAATQQPAMVVLDWPGRTPSASDPQRIAWVGKGIVYDTGGLSIKTKTGMPGMKTDMAGAAAVLAGFCAAARLGYDQRLTAVLCIAENAVGPGSVRPDDVIQMHSGRTVEVNNTDAEGRLVLADGVAWVSRNRDPTQLVDMATLTGAQSVATGKRHGALYCSSEELEASAVRAGRRSGDLVHPLPYAPELFRREFNSTVADMRNSVKDRSNAQSSCAGQFIGNHLFAAGYTGPWLHVDMAGPSVSAHRGTGFGVGLLLSMIGVV
ncbi:MAG: leucyl aminopeptidase family protein [Myxococcales bacterium]|nr:leucyl aminopeptidase family protein [Myxococcales bacterium]